MASSSNSTFAVALTVDQSYAIGAAVTIASLADHFPKGLDLDVWLLHTGLDKAGLGLISRATDRGTGRLHEFELSARQLALPVVSDYISNATFGRLYLGDILPLECKRVLYLDCDILVTGDLQELLNIDLGNRMMAAVSEPTVPVDVTPRTYERLRDPHLDPDMPYFNAGVLIIDLDSWRRARIGERALSFVAQHRPTLMDQDALNAVTRGQWLELDPMWNTITYWFRSRSRQHRYKSLLRRSRVIHYAGHRKPWLRGDVWKAERWLQYLCQLDPDRLAQCDKRT